jgi:hypothetical protein
MSTNDGGECALLFTSILTARGDRCSRVSTLAFTLPIECWTEACTHGAIGNPVTNFDTGIFVLGAFGGFGLAAAHARLARTAIFKGGNAFEKCHLITDAIAKEFLYALGHAPDKFGILSKVAATPLTTLI